MSTLKTTPQSSLSFASLVTLPGLIAVLLLVVFLMLQNRLWFGEGSLAEIWQLRKAIHTQQQDNTRLLSRNRRLTAEVTDLKQGLNAVEGRARMQLGMVKSDETFYLIIDQ